MDKWYYAGPGEHVSLYTICAGASERVNITLTADAQSSIKCTIVFIDDTSRDCAMTLSCMGPDAIITVKVLSMITQGQTMRLTTQQHHAVPSCQSSVLSHGVVNGDGMFDVSGIITIDKQAPHTDAKLYTKALLLSDDARAVAKPQLEVLNNDVSCSHGAATGYPDDEQIYYLKSRGIAATHARSMIVRGFVGHIINDFSVHQRDAIWQECKNKLL